MTTSTTVVGVPFSVESAAPRPSLATLRIRFTNDPQQSNPATSSDGLNPANYTLTGPNILTVTSASVVPDDPQSLDLALSAPLSPGVWTVTAANIQTAFADPLNLPVSANFTVVIGVNLEAVNQGATNDSAESVFRKNLSSAFGGKFWDAIIAALATGDKKNWDNARSAFDQIFLSSATGKYTDQRAADRGLSRPADVGLSDEQFRDLAIKITAGKLTAESVYEILEIFYGPDATRGSLTTDLAEPFSLVNGLFLDILIDEVDSVRVIFREADFVQVSQAKATEVAAAITRAVRDQNLKAWAVPFVNPETGTTRVRIYSPSLGLGSSIRITGGSVQDRLRFPTILLTNGPNPGVVVGENWTITIPAAGKMRITSSNSASVDLSGVQSGDYLNLYGAGFNILNRGSFPITNVDVRYVGGLLTQYVEVLNPVVVAEGPIAIALTSDLTFFRPIKGSILGSRSVIVCQAAANLLNIILPATSPAVQRQALKAAYLKYRAPVLADSFSRSDTGTTFLTFSNPHGLNVGDWFFLDNATPDLPAAITYPTAHWDPNPPPDVTNPIEGSVSVSIGNTAYTFGGLGAFFSAVDDVNILAISGSPSAYSKSASAGAAGMGARYRAQASILHDNNRIWVTGGRNGPILNTTSIYNAALNSWTAGPNLITGRERHAQCSWTDPTALLTYPSGLIVVSGGLDSGGFCLDTVEVGHLDGGATFVGGSMMVKRADHRQVETKDKFILFIGGQNTDTGDIHATVEKVSFGAQVQTGNMTYARHSFVAVPLPDGRVLVVGGNGMQAGTPASEAAWLRDAEMWDPSTGRWYGAGKTPVTYTNPQGHYIPSINMVMIFGQDGGTNDTISLYDVATGKWRVGPISAGFNVFNNAFLTDYSSTVLANGAVVVVGGSFGGTSFPRQSLWIPGVLSIVSNGFSGQMFKVATVPNSTLLTFETVYTGPTGASGATGPILVTPATAIASGTLPGPYVYDPDLGVSITGTSTTTTQKLDIGQQYTSIPVADATRFPDADGWVAVGFGTKYGQKLRYRGRFSATALAVDPGYRFTETVPSGTSVTLLDGSGPFVPASPETAGSFYLTGSAAGRVAAQNSVASMLAAGVNVDVKIEYPGDHGLGGAGLPTSGAQKLSDIVGVFAGNSEDAEVQKARSS